MLAADAPAQRRTPSSRSGVARRAARFLASLAWLWTAAVVAASLATPLPAAAASSVRLERYDYVVSTYQSTLAALAKTVTKPLDQLRKDLASTEAAGNARNTAVVAEQVLTKAPRDGALWAKIAGLYLDSEPLNDQDGYELPNKALAAAIIANRFSKTPADQASTLELIALALADKEDWRPALNAYKASLAFADDKPTSATPMRRCGPSTASASPTTRSRAMPPSRASASPFPTRADASVSDFAPYFTQEPGPVSAVTVEGSKLCLEGLKHGERYTITARQGLPSAVDEPLSKDYRIRRLCARPRAGRALRRQDLCPAAHRPERRAGHLGQLQAGQAGGLPRRRPQPDLGGDRFELPPAALWRERRGYRPLQGPEGVGGHARHGRAGQRGRDDRLPGRRGARHRRRRASTS